MAQSTRPRLVRHPKQDQEIHLFQNPLNDYEQSEASVPLVQVHPPKPSHYDYQSPTTATSLRPNSRWLIVRHHLHRIRLMDYDGQTKKDRLPDLYLGYQMIRELKRAQEEIKNIDKQKDFRILKEFSLANAGGSSQTYNTSHVKADDALIYDRLGEEPLALQNLLYYFSKTDVPHGTDFWNFLNGVNQVLKLKRKRTVLVQRLRKLALTLAIILYSCIGLMLCLMIISVITTVTKMNDPEVVWLDQTIDAAYSTTLSLTR